MILFPAIDIYDGKVVRLFKGNYDEMTVYGDNVIAVAKGIEEKGGTHLHAVDLEGAKNGNAANFRYIREICENTSLKVEIGGGIRDKETMEKYISIGVDRIILGTKAATDRSFLEEAVKSYGEKIAVGVDAKEEKVAVKGWLEVLDLDLYEFIDEIREIGVKHIIVTDIAKDGAMNGINKELFEKLSRIKDINVTASGGVSTTDDIRQLKELGIYGVILGKAMYNGAIDLREALSI